MDLNATYLFNAPVSQVWELLMDTEAVGSCLPGCRGLRPLGEDRYETDLAVAVAAISGNFKGTIALKDQRPPHSYRLLIEGSGRAGFVRGEAVVTLVPQDEGTSVHIAAQADVGGTIVRVGQRLLEGVARMTMDRFYGCLMARVQS